MTGKLLSRLCALCVASVVAVPVFAERSPQHITVLTGGETGVYYAAGQAMCRILARTQTDHRLACQALGSSGGVANVRAVLNGQAQIALIQSSHLHKALNRLPPFTEAARTADLRVLFALHHEVFTILARRDAGVAHFNDLRGMRLNVGNPGSGQRDALDDLLQSWGWTHEVFAMATELDAAEQAPALGDGNIDAMTYFVGHPNAALEEASSVIDARLVAVSGRAVEHLLSSKPYYTQAEVPGGLYRGSPKATPSIGVRALVASTRQTPADTVYELVRAVFENLPRLQHAHPALAGLDEASMRLTGDPSSLHEGALRYYRERGWLPES